MNLIRELYARFRVLVHEVAKFGVVGAIGFIVQLGVQNPLHYSFGVGALTSVVFGYVIATCVTFVGNRYWAFKHRQGRGLGHESAMFVVLNAVGIGIQLGCVALVTYGLGFKDHYSYNAATIVGIGMGTMFRLYSYRKFVFLAVPPSVDLEALEPEPSGR